jgi:hypothetical protein
VTEQEWLSGTHPGPMLEYLRGKATDRKLRLFAVASWVDGLPPRPLEADQAVARSGTATGL